MAYDVLESDGSDGGTTQEPVDGVTAAAAATAGVAVDDARLESFQPLAGAVLCCTAIAPEARADLVAAAAPLGATHALDLTAAVTHLLVGNWDTAKYAFVARARADVLVLHPDFVDAVRQQWMSGTDHVDMAALERTHAYPALQGTLVCLTGFADADERRSIEDQVRQAGGRYTGDLTREVTHLIAAQPTGAKYVHARQWQVRVVVRRWLTESLERGMVLDAARYDPLLPEADIGRGAWVRPKAGRPTPAKRKSGDELTAAVSAPARKLRRTASARFNSQNENIWGDIVGGPRAAVEESRDAWHHENGDETAHSARPDEVLRRTVSTGSLASKAAESQPRTDGLFSGTHVYVHGFGGRETAVLERHLRTHAATLLDLPEEFARVHRTTRADGPLPFLILVPHTFYPADASTLPAVLDFNPMPPLATEFYLEACLHAHQRFDPTASPLYAPLPAHLPGLEHLTLCATGFADVALLHLAKAVQRFGAAYTGTLRADVSALICPEADAELASLSGAQRAPANGRSLSRASSSVSAPLESRDKVRFARAHRIPVVGAGWLWACLRAQKHVPWDTWIISSAVADTSAASVPSERDRRATSHAAGDSDSHATAVMPAQPRQRPKAALPLAIDTSAAPLAAAAAATTGSAPTSAVVETPALGGGGGGGGGGKETPLAAALSTLLAARSRSATHSFDTAYAPAGHGENADGATGRRRRRPLLGRAPSTASLRSVGSANTDGVGTPVEGEAAGDQGLHDGRDETTNQGAAEATEPPPTQVAYADVPAAEWRRRMDERMREGPKSRSKAAERADESTGRRVLRPRG